MFECNRSGYVCGGVNDKWMWGLNEWLYAQQEGECYVSKISILLNKNQRFTICVRMMGSRLDLSL